MVNSGDLFIEFFADFLKLLNMISHEIFLKRLYEHGIRRSPFNACVSYLKERYQHVKITSESNLSVSNWIIFWGLESLQAPRFRPYSSFNLHQWSTMFPTSLCSTFFFFIIYFSFFNSNIILCKVLILQYILILMSLAKYSVLKKKENNLRF